MLHLLHHLKAFSEVSVYITLFTLFLAQESSLWCSVLAFIVPSLHLLQIEADALGITLSPSVRLFTRNKTQIHK